ncbi:MAG: AAA family ATPase, partial [Geminicoccaceae bacterium]|nr:AAA family ATPase [Geminicoccaceae bacterium]
MIEQIVEITNVGTFHGFRPEKPIELRKLTLVYGPNGTGKTTLCAILRSLARNEPDILKGRKTLNRDGESRVELELSGGKRCVWDGTAWTGEAPEIEIYDEQFVRDNLFTDTVELDHQHNLFQVILGEQAVAIAQEILNKTKQSEEIQRAIREKEKEIDQIIGNPDRREWFLAASADPDIDAEIESQRKRVAAHESAPKLRNERGLDPLPLPAPLAGLEELLGRSFEDLAEEAEQLVR